MPILSFEFSKDLKASVEYVTKERGDDDEFHAEDCMKESAVDNFKAVKTLHNKEGHNQTLNLVQSWHPKEANMKTPEQFNELGRELVSRLFPGHQYVIRTHTDKGHIHNHISINTIHQETGARIQNEKKLKNGKGFLAWMRSENDKIALENGLSVLHKDAHAREAKIPFSVQKMERNKKDSIYIAMAQGGDFARELATSYDEYTDILSAFGITARVEKKNITYFYQGYKKGIRGKPHRALWDKKRLEEAFKANDEKFKNHPDLRAQLRGQIEELKNSPTLVWRDGNGKPRQPGITGKDYSKFTPQARKGKKQWHESDKELHESIVPISEIKKARTASIFDYCKKEKIPLIKNANGESVLKGREYIMVGEFGWKNTRNKAQGSLIEFMRDHKGITTLQAISRINNNPNLLLLEKHFGEQRTKFKLLYIPKSEEQGLETSLKRLGYFLQTQGVNPRAAQSLLSRKNAQVTSKGAIRLYPADKHTGAFEFEEHESGKFQKKKLGKVQSPFYSEKGTGSKAIVFTDPLSFMAARGSDPFRASSGGKSVLALFDSGADVVDQFVAGNPHVKTLQFVSPHGRSFSKGELDLFENLKSRYHAYGIQIETKGLDQALKREGPDLSR